MTQNKKFNGLDTKLLAEALIRSTLWGVAVGAAASFLCAFVCWFLSFCIRAEWIFLYAISTVPKRLMMSKRMLLLFPNTPSYQPLSDSIRCLIKSKRCLQSSLSQSEIEWS